MFSLRTKRLRTTGLLPFSELRDGCFQLSDGTNLDILQICCKDLYSAGEDERQWDFLHWTKLYKTYVDDLKIVSMNFPTDVSQQKEYLTHKLNGTQNPVYRYWLEYHFEELEYIEEKWPQREYYLFVFSKDADAHKRNVNSVLASLEDVGLVRTLPDIKKKQVLYKLNNKAGSLYGQHWSERRVSRRKKDPEALEQIIKRMGYDPYLLEDIQPQGGISFRDDRFIQTGDGYELCLHVTKYSRNIGDFWLSDLLHFPNTVTTVDVATEDLEEVKKNINQSLREQKARFETAKKDTDRTDARERVWELEELYEELSQMGDAMKLLETRIFLAGRTREEVETAAEKCAKQLDGQGFKCHTALNEGWYDWTSVYQPFAKQQAQPYHRPGQPVPAFTLAGGDPFNFSCLNDPYGLYIGPAAMKEGGSVNLDLFAKTEVRLSYNSLVIGRQGSGKTTLLKKLLKTRAILGDYIRGFDVMGDFTNLIQHLGGSILYLDGSGGILNHLDILATGDSQEASFSQQISKMNLIYRFFAPGCDLYEALAFEQVIRELYLDFGVIPKSCIQDGKINWADPALRVTGLPPEQYPTYSDLLHLIERRLDVPTSSMTAVQKQLHIDELRTLRRIQAVIQNLVQSYGAIFDGHTSIPDVLDEQIVFFNIKRLASLKDEIFDAQLINALYLCNDNARKVGSAMMDRYNRREIAWEDIRRTLILIDEAHHIVNAKKTVAVDNLKQMMRENRHYFSGILFASQNIQDFVPDGASDQGLLAIRVLFSLAQYKFILGQDGSDMKKLESVFPRELTERNLQTIPRYGKGECLMLVSGDNSLEFSVDISAEEERLFAGGA